MSHHQLSMSAIRGSPFHWILGTEFSQDFPRNSMHRESTWKSLLPGFSDLGPEDFAQLFRSQHAGRGTNKVGPAVGLSETYGDAKLIHDQWGLSNVLICLYIYIYSYVYHIPCSPIYSIFVHFFNPMPSDFIVMGLPFLPFIALVFSDFAQGGFAIGSDDGLATLLGEASLAGQPKWFWWDWDGLKMVKTC